ncbi:uncharacterized protein C4orf19 homolog [Nycticebus coucang]|uniref:uncharacterized protein C4orf19 homolog n=1 Tax=Nycticebus coucang TaxID=9470 RepID=UPI00234D204D|nr:uncharacterized protein C4orf19 homolog [Nycticebus coucang]XP_053433616.1 uncharacterized protein C4orf19 homolog [Nycticebus coucang]XP_053433617.1 uncharacterized protein C4orf19 homolog [Nycticebus coucang]XP_053433618.1 uncharacterized protein C4orf19 homolog [Nycticebus coucang]XP_053433619.1 uncharacterized protein C4orf19 homolog [Nycticebus coucang]XP_053433620.1 uncharacterized protein C4orf19 homolog [Nycticebus coucang]XP_053433621.1 uncharacterized protein C4orf19 homolog [Nyc
MGCRCCKMIQSYLFDPVPLPSPGYDNEVNSCKLDEEDTVKLKGKQSSEFLVQKNDPPREGLRRTQSRARGTGPQEANRPQQGWLPQGDSGGGYFADGAVNGISPTAAPQPGGNPRPTQDGKNSWASTANSIHPTQPFLEAGSTGNQDRALPALEATQVTHRGDSRAPSKAQTLSLDSQELVPQIPAPDYPQLWGPAVDSVDHEEKDCLFENHTADEPPEDSPPGVGEHGLNMPFSVKRSWDSLNEAVATEVLNVYFKEEGPAQAMPVGDSGNRQEDDRGSDRDGETVDEDAAVAEALAALEAATAGEDVDETD